jgi:hypothetical protein
MKTVMSGAALMAILALAMPAWAQAPNANPPQEKAAPAPMPQTTNAHTTKTHAAKPTRATKATHARKMSHRNTHHAAMRHEPRTTASRGSARPSDNVANQLNRAEAQRVMSGGSTPPIGNPNMAPMNPPSQPMPGQ